MKFIPALTEADSSRPGNCATQGQTHHQRQRAHAVLLFAKGFTLEQLADIFSVDRDTVSGWLKLWQERRLDGLADAPKPGRFRKIDGSLEAVLRDILIENPSPNMKALLQAELKKRQTSLLGHCKALPKTTGVHFSPGTQGA